MFGTLKNLSVLFLSGLPILGQVNMAMGVGFPTSMISLDNYLVLQRICF